jgi:hypothetical protein
MFILFVFFLQCCGWFRIGFNPDPDLAFYLDADLGPGSRTNPDLEADPNPDPGQTLKSQKV